MVPFAVSVHHFISSVGADAGFASLIGLALLVLLYFAHARETATLRARADEAGMRVEELEAQLADLADQVAALPAEISVRAASPRAAAAYGAVPGPVVGGVPAGAGAVAGNAGGTLLPPAAPAGVGAPALAAATRLIPMPELPSAPSSPPSPPSPEYEPVSTVGGNGASRPVVAASAATMQRPVQAPPGGSRPGAGPSRVGSPGGGGYPGGGARVGGGGARPGAGQPRGAGVPRSAVPLRPAPRRSRTGRVLAALLVVLVAAVAVGAGVYVLGRHHHSSPAKSTAAQSMLRSRRRAAASLVNPALVTVSVLNGTDLAGAAGRVSAQLVRDGYRKGTVANASDQTQTTTVVQYMPHDQRDAAAVAASLKLSPTVVQRIDSTTQQLACPPSSACTSAVVVTVGRDLAAQ